MGRNAGGRLSMTQSQIDFGTVRMRFRGAEPRAHLEGLDRLAGNSAYYIGSDPRRWRTGVPQYGRVAYRQLYAGVDLILYGSASHLEYDLNLRPHAALDKVTLDFDGAFRLAVDADGDLRIESSRGVLIQKRPLVYQEIDGMRRHLAASYTIAGSQVRFAVQGYDPARRLVIDPEISYATYFGGAGEDVPWSLAVDQAGNTYFAGSTASPAFPHASGTPHGGEDVFVVKLDPTGRNVLYSVILGGGSDDEAYSIALDPAGNAYLSGGTASADFPTLNAYQSTNKGGWDAFVAKLDASGALAYSTYLGGGRAQACDCYPSEFAWSIAADASGAAYVAGETWSADFPAPAGTQLAVHGGGDAFVAKLSPTGSLLFSALIGGSDWDAAYAIAVDSAGSIWLAGDTLSHDLPVTAGALQGHYGGGGAQAIGDVWVAHVNPQDAIPIAALTYFGGAGDDNVYALKLDRAGNVCLAGSTLSPDFPVTSDALQAGFGGGTTSGDGFFARLAPSLAARVYATYFGGSGEDSVSAIALDTAGDIYLAGSTSSATLTPLSLGTNSNAFQPAYLSGGDGFLLELNPQGTAPLFFSYIGGGGVGAIAGAGQGGLAIDGAGNAYFLGGVLGNGIPVTQALQPNLAGGEDAFLLKMRAPAAPVTITQIRPTGGSTGIAQNTWLEIYGTGLAPAGAANGFTWDTAPEFASGLMPTALMGVNVKVNGKPAYVFYISPGQVNVLSPLDNASGPVQVQLTNGSDTVSGTANMVSAAPAFLPVAVKYVLAQHADYSLLGPASLSAPGYPFTPARPGEPVVLWANGFGLPAIPPVQGSATQFGALPQPFPVVKIGGISITADWAGLVSPGLLQINVTIPAAAVDGDNTVTATYGGYTTPIGPVITVQH